jgi:hypothetical protein
VGRAVHHRPFGLLEELAPAMALMTVGAGTLVLVVAARTVAGCASGRLFKLMAVAAPPSAG